MRPLQPGDLLRLNDVRRLIPLSRSALYALMSTDGFPRPIKFGRTSVWRRDEIEAYVAAITTVR